MIEPGQTAPDFELPDQDGNPVRLSDLRGGRVVLYFYPKADTPGCTTQACGIRDHRADYDAAGADRPRRLARPGQGGQEVPRQAVAELHAAGRRGPRGLPRRTACGSRSRCTAGPTWARSARPSSSTARASSATSSRRPRRRRTTTRCSRRSATLDRAPLASLRPEVLDHLHVGVLVARGAEGQDLGAVGPALHARVTVGRRRASASHVPSSTISSSSFDARAAAPRRRRPPPARCGGGRRARGSRARAVKWLMPRVLEPQRPAREARLRCGA